MTYQSIPNQPIIFRDQSEFLNSCECGNNDYKQFVDFSDQLSFQLESNPCQSSIFGGSITIQGGWVIEGASVVSNTASSLAFFSQIHYPQQPHQIVRVRITVQEITGSLNISIPNGGTQTITVAGSYTLFFNTDILQTANTFNITITGATFVGSFILNDIATLPSDLYLNVVDAETLDFVAAVEPIITLGADTVTANFELPEAIEAGCYRFGISDYCDNDCGQHFIFNSLFATSPSGIVGWSSVPVTGTTNWDLNIGEASIDLTSNDITDLRSVTELCAGKEYTVTVEVESISNARIRFKVGGETQSGQINTAGTQSLTFTPTVSGQFAIQAVQIVSTPSEITISRVSIQVVNEDAELSTYSDVMDIGEYSGCEYFRLEGCNGEGQFGFEFQGTSFFPGIRLHGRKLRPQYTTDVDTFRYASGRWDVPYADRQKRYTYAFAQLPEYVTDFLSVLVYFDNLYVNGQLYFPLDGEFPDIEYNDANDFGNLEIELALKDSKVRKTKCIGVDAECLPTIIDALNGDFILTEQGEVVESEAGDSLIVE